MNRPTNIVILTGAGISAESGVATFRGPGGLWEGHRVEDVCTPEALARDPVLVHRFYDARRVGLASVEPNAAHLALARLDAAWAGDLLIVTQNVDDLHERAGAKRVLHMHGELRSALCAACGARAVWEGDMLAQSNHVRPEPVEGPSCYSESPEERQGFDKFSPNGEGFVAPNCAECSRPTIRPDIVFFGEMPYQMERIEAAIAGCDLFVSVGTSGAVYPAAGFVQTARWHGAATLELNLEPSQGSVLFDESRMGPAGRLVPEWVDEVLGA